MATQTIRVSQGGSEDLYEITAVDAKAQDLSAVDVKLSFGTLSDPSATWVDANKVVTGSSVTFSVTVGSGGVAVDPGVYYVWVKLTDGTKVIIRMLDFIVSVK